MHVFQREPLDVEAPGHLDDAIERECPEAVGSDTEMERNRWFSADGCFCCESTVACGRAPATAPAPSICRNVRREGWVIMEAP